MRSSAGKIGFIGAGNMATALIFGLMESGLYDASEIRISDIDPKRIESLSKEFKLKGSESNDSLVKECNIVVLSVKPQIVRSLCEEIKEALSSAHLIISIAAGIPIKLIRGIIGPDIPIIRVMPNTPALVQKGMSALTAGSLVTPEQLEVARSIFDAVGQTTIIPEEMMDSVTALSGSGPGFLFRIMEAFVNAGVELGFEEKVSTQLVLQTFLGTAHLALESEKSLSELREMVTSPGGTTATGLSILDGKNMEWIIVEAIQAARKRGEELADA